MARFWVYLDNKVQGPVDIPGLRKLTGFNLLTQVCQEGQESWRMADEVIEIKAYFAAPPRGARLAEETQPDLPAEKPQMEMPLSVAVVETLPPLADESPGMPAGQGFVETLPDSPMVVGNTAVQASASPESLRKSCATCGYKNPRDVNVCMKCGAPLKSGSAATEPPKISLSALASPEEHAAPAAAAKPSPLQAAADLKPSVSAMSAGSPMVEIPVKRIALIMAGILATGTVLFGIRHAWVSWRHHKSAKRTVVIQDAPEPSTHNASTEKSPAKTRTKKKPAATERSAAEVLPGVAAAPAAPAEEKPKPKKEPAPRPTETETATEDTSPPASYKVVSQAYPLKHRTSSPVDSKYAVKRRGEGGLWAQREDEAVQLAQNQRIYGGLRTIRRNAEILMLVLRDREYTTAFEAGKRIYLFNDADWAAIQKDNPVYEVQLTLSGGKEPDGSSRTPLRFAFKVDLERKSVEPGGSGMVKSNTMHAFYDESRIPPEDRRSVAKDTEELVRAAQPGGSPLTLESVTKQYAATYSYPAMTRVADAFGLTLVTKKLSRQTSSVNDVLPAEIKAAAGQTTASAAPASTPAPARTKPDLPASASGAIDFKIQRGTGKEQDVTVRVPSAASPARIWETLTSYDRLTQFVPDLLVSQRQGQDGSAVIVHTVFLSRLMFFVFKTNLHLRIIERPKDHRLEFERLAGDFEKFSGYVEINPDPTGTRSAMNVHITLVPKGYVPQWAVRGMATNFFPPVLEAIRSKAESN